MTRVESNEKPSVLGMRDQFRGYYQPTPDELDKLWTRGVIVLDANALLNLFRYSATTRDELIKLLQKERLRLWLPHQVAHEFHENRLSIPGKQASGFANFAKDLAEAKSSVESSISKLGTHPTHEAEQIRALVEKHMGKLVKGVEKATQRHIRAVIDKAAHDEVFEQIANLYDGRVGLPCDEERVKAISAEGETRYARKVPPGYKDADKKDNKFGDLVLWMQMLDYARATKLPMIFVTDDVKEDWWLRVSGRTHGARPELVEEYYAASGERVHLYTVRRFLEYAKERGEDISDGSINEAREVRTVAESRRNTASSVASAARIALMRERDLQELIDAGVPPLTAINFQLVRDATRRTEVDPDPDFLKALASLLGEHDDPESILRLTSGAEWQMREALYQLDTEERRRHDAQYWDKAELDARRRRRLVMPPPLFSEDGSLADDRNDDSEPGPRVFE